MASTTAVGGDFLARMMRPTQASASKTHEKVEQKTPPKKLVFSQPKKVSDEDSKQAGSKSVQPEPAAEEEKPAQGSSTSEHQSHTDEGTGSNEMGSTTEGTDNAQEADMRSSAEESAQSNIEGTGTGASDPVSVP